MADDKKRGTKTSRFGSSARISHDSSEYYNSRLYSELRNNQEKAHTPENDFPEEELQKAHKLVYNKALVDIISMIKHGARAESPLYTAAERVDRALDKVMADKTFDEEQTEWLGYIREHLVENLTLEMDDFDDMPVFERQGGSRRAKKVFGDDLTPLIRDINYAIAA